MNSVKKTEDEEYQEWVAKNEKFLDRYTKEHPEKFEKIKINDNLDLFEFFKGLSHSQWQELNRDHIYVELQDLLKMMVPYYMNEFNGRK